MIIAQTPLRVSFFGGGTDFPEFFAKGRGAVLATAINQSIFHAVTYFHSKLFNYSIRLAYSKVETVRSLDEIEHAPFREVLRRLGCKRDVEVSLAADLPAYSGLGSSSSFTVGLLNALRAHKGQFVAPQALAAEAIEVERSVLKETVGCQDQVTAAFGGTNVIEFSGRDRFVVSRVAASQERTAELDRSLALFFTGVTRRARDVEAAKVARFAQKDKNLKRMLRQVDEGHAILTGNRPLSAFGRLLDKTWREKRALDESVSSPAIDAMYARALEAGALGGKLLGAGGGGFMLLFVPPERKAKLRRALKDFTEVRFSIDAPGSRIIHS